MVSFVRDNVLLRELRRQHSAVRSTLEIAFNYLIIVRIIYRWV